MPLVYPPVLQYVDEEGQPIRFGQAYFTATGTSSPVEVYQDEEFAVPHTDPVVADANGQFPPIHYNPALGFLRIRITAESGDLANPIIDADPINDQALEIIQTIAINLTVRGTTTAGAWLGGIVSEYDLTIPKLLTGSLGKKPKTLPTAAYVVTAKVGATPIGTFTCGLDGNWTVVGTASTDTLVSVGSEIDFFGPATVDATMADFGLVLRATVAV